MESNEILQLTVELPDGGSEIIVVHDTDEPADLAQEFCQRYGLDSKCLESLTNMIEQNIDLLLQSESNEVSQPVLEKAKFSLVKQALVLPSRKRPESPFLYDQARQVHETFTKLQGRRPTSAAPTQKKLPERDNINRYGIKTQARVPKAPQRKYYDRLDQYFTLFELLNPNNEGKISPDSLSIPALPAYMMQIISPLISELKSSHKTIGFSDFTQAMDKIMSSLEDGSKALLLETNHKKETICNKPGKLTVYDRQMLLRLKNEEKLKEKRMLKENAELKECKFQPALRGRK